MTLWLLSVILAALIGAAAGVVVTALVTGGRREDEMRFTEWKDGTE